MPALQKVLSTERLVVPMAGSGWLEPKCIKTTDRRSRLVTSHPSVRMFAVGALDTGGVGGYDTSLGAGESDRLRPSNCAFVTLGF